MACELAGSDYSFSPYGPSHWAALNENFTCPDLVIDPTFVHYYPGNEEQIIMSMNQFKYRHLKKFQRSRRSSNSPQLLLATSKRQEREEQIKDYVKSLMTCSSSIRPMRRVQRCWSSKVPCSEVPSSSIETLISHANYQQEAKKIFSSSS